MIDPILAAYSAALGLCLGLFLGIGVVHYHRIEDAIVAWLKERL